MMYRPGEIIIAGLVRTGRPTKWTRFVGGVARGGVCGGAGGVCDGGVEREMEGAGALRGGGRVSMGRGDEEVW